MLAPTTPTKIARLFLAMKYQWVTGIWTCRFLTHLERWSWDRMRPELLLQVGPPGALDQSSHWLRALERSLLRVNTKPWSHDQHPQLCPHKGSASDKGGRLVAAGPERDAGLLQLLTTLTTTATTHLVKHLTARCRLLVLLNSTVRRPVPTHYSWALDTALTGQQTLALPLYSGLGQLHTKQLGAGSVTLQLDREETTLSLSLYSELEQ